MKPATVSIAHYGFAGKGFGKEQSVERSREGKVKKGKRRKNIERRAWSIK